MVSQQQPEVAILYGGKVNFKPKQIKPGKESHKLLKGKIQLLYLVDQCSLKYIL